MSVLFITVDHLAARAVGSYDHAVVETPCLDRFATRAIRFNRCYCQTPASNGSRSSVLTGLRAETTGILQEDDSYDALVPARVRSAPEILRQYGFRTAKIGKLFCRPQSARRPLSAFDRLADANGLAPREADRQRARLASEILTETACEKVPFAMWLNFSSLETTLRYSRKDGDPYDRDFRCAADQSNGTDKDTCHGCAQPIAGDALEELLDMYATCVSFIDAQIGMILETIDRVGLGNDTIIVIFSSCGFHLGQQGLWGSGTLFEPSTRVPLLTRVPGVTRRQVVCDEITELVDVLPTVCELLMVPTPDRLEGKSLVPLLRDPLQPWKRAAFTTCARDGCVGRSVRTKRWRYTDWQTTGGVRRHFELYDLETDPLEQTNLTTDPRHRNERTILANLLQRGWRAAQ